MSDTVITPKKKTPSKVKATKKVAKTADSSVAPKRRGRLPGSKNKAKKVANKVSTATNASVLKIQLEIPENTRLTASEWAFLTQYKVK